MSAETEHKNADKVIACAIARDIEAFDLLIEDMETEFDENWGALTFEAAEAALNSEIGKDLKLVTIAVDKEDENDLTPVANAIRAASDKGIKVILIPNELNTVALHQLMRMGCDDFAPYPLPEGALHDAIERISNVPAPQPVAAPGAAMPPADTTRSGIVLPVYGLGGGVGATTFAANLAWELQKISEKENKKVCILDFDFQYGAVSTYLDVPRSEAVFEFLSDAAATDATGLQQAMAAYKDRLDVLSSPIDALPLEFVEPDGIQNILTLAKSSYDFVIVDVPQALVSWSETVLEEAQLYFAVLELDMRCAQNALRFVRTLKAEDLPFEKVQFALNRAPKFTDMSGKQRVKRMGESLEIDFRYHLPDGGKAVSNAGDEGVPLAEIAAKNPLRKEIFKIAKTLSELVRDDTQ
ncbi:AAA family ATPase [Neptunicoccus cionae]|uniref:AAA family ATPase n=1 Tax=Neptunicoccus cionae TaxID=2035344 RepID=UPI000C78BBCF|nr:AAA family ATPase [Amylibacter cionae]PLS23366.1 pilus assembly protein CpaE [Amylibacter cionae]